ncbi:GNAT family N-acetyltransferase [Arthrobacter sp. PAMC 25486]|uniref:GNAT family N-acetyltransferase n=1 Tax=Arthrobacter sp. PAMC 25486 TaxID=1494608 RepID=UPI00138E1715|nr:GNAT family protein [Arthrobacter sp. PAMC 25486]
MPAEFEITTVIEPLSLAVFPELFAFERDNREYFAEWVPDRGDEYFLQFQANNQALINEQTAGDSFFFIVRDETNRLVGRVNLVDVREGSISLGFRIAQKATGIGHAGRAVKLACAFGQKRGIQTITAMTTLANRGSQRILERSGFGNASGNPAFVLLNGLEHKMLHYARDLNPKDSLHG